MSDVTLEVENRVLVVSPSLLDVSAAVHALTPRGGPSFLILERPNKEFAQAAGGDGRYTLEWREQYGEGFCQWKAGWPVFETADAAADEVKVRTNGYVVRVRPNEVLVASDVLAILNVFLSGQERPRTYVWRVMATEEFSSG